MSKKNLNETIGNRTRDLPACIAVPQPTTPRRTVVTFCTSLNLGDKRRQEIEVCCKITCHVYGMVKMLTGCWWGILKKRRLGTYRIECDYNITAYLKEIGFGQRGTDRCLTCQARLQAQEISIMEKKRDELFIQFIENQGPPHVSSITCSFSGGAKRAALGILCASCHNLQTSQQLQLHATHNKHC
jgi:hypothetical protein